MKKGFFITGTDTGVGKTTIACHLLTLLQARGFTTAAIKPIASGGELIEGVLQNQDALLLQAAATIKHPYDWVNPYCFEAPIAPHIAAQQQGVKLKVDGVMRACQKILNTPVDYIIVEGAGGFKVPLNLEESTVDLAKVLGFPIILVIALKLGCLNHSLLSVDAIQQSGLDWK